MTRLPHPAQIIGLAQRQSKRNLSVEDGLQRISMLNISSYFEHNSVITSSSYVDWLPDPAQIIGLVHRQSKRNLSVDNGLQRISMLKISSYFQHNSVITKSS